MANDFSIEDVQIDATFEIYAAGTTWGSIDGNIQNQTDLYNALNSKADVTALDDTNATITALTTTVNDNYSTLDGKIDTVQSNLSGDISALSRTVIANNTSVNNALDVTNQRIFNLATTVSANTTDISTIKSTLTSYGDIVTHNVTEFATATQGSLADTALQPNDNITELTNNAGYITDSALSGYATETWVENKNYITGIDSSDVTTALGYAPVNPASLATVATSGSYADLMDKPTIGDGATTILVNSTSVGTITANQTSASAITINIPTTATEVGALPSDTTINDLTTESQQNALNSGITSAYVSQISANTSAIDVNTSAIAANTSAISSKQDLLSAGNNITLNGNTISATDTTYSAGQNITITNGTISAISTSYTAGENISINNGTISATDTTYEAGSGITITNGTISASSTAYSAGNGIDINGNTISVSTTIASKTDIGNANLTIQRNGSAIGTFSANATSALTVDISVPTTATEVGALPSDTVIGDGAVIFQKNGSAISTITANQTSTTTVNFTIPTTASDVNALPDTTTIGSANTTITVNSTAVGTINANATSDGAVNISVPIVTNTYNASGTDAISGTGVASALSTYQLKAQDVYTLATGTGTIWPPDNSVNKLNATGNTTFVLPTVTDLTKFHQIFVQLNMSTVYTIDLGTTYYFNSTAPDLSASGEYNLIYEYDNIAQHWVVGCIPKGAAS